MISWSQALPPAQRASATTSTPQNGLVDKLTLSGPLATLDWKSLTPVQQIALKPLAGSWETLSDLQKRKWISLSSNFSRISSADQAKLHARMAQWAALSPKQRENARLNFAEVQKITPEQKSEQWRAYQALSPEARQKLAKSAQPTPPRTALAPKPVPPGKINRLPVKTSATTSMPLAASAAMPASLPQPPTAPAVPASLTPPATTD